MATFTEPSYEPDFRAHDAAPVPQSSDVVALDTSINGLAMQQNAISEFAYQNLQNGDLHMHDAPSELVTAVAGSPQLDPLGIGEPDSDGANVADGHISQSDEVLPGPDSMHAPSSKPVTIGAMGSDHHHGQLPVAQVEQPSDEDFVIVSHDEALAFAVEPSLDAPEQKHGQQNITELETLPSPQSNNFQDYTSSPTVEFQESVLLAPSSMDVTETAAPTEDMAQNVNDDMANAAISPNKLVREREGDEEEQRLAKRAKLDEGQLPEAEFKVPEVPSSVVTASIPHGATAVTPESINSQQIASHYDFGSAMTETQRRRLAEGLRNIQKGKHSRFFRVPVDYVAFKIPHYPTVITRPMDLGTMSQKLKDGVYASVSDFIADFDLIVNNAITFNGKEHLVAQEAMMMNAQFQKQLKTTVPKSGEDFTTVTAKARTPPVMKTSQDSKRRISKSSLGGASSPTNGLGQTFALVDGLPSIRRDSNTADGRPKREIKKAPSRDLPYLTAPPKKKKYQTELRFCEHVYNEMTRKRYLDAGSIGAAFQVPVDPVALNIPSYNKIVKKPMDMRTIGEKLHAAQYENAKEFEADVRLMFANCYKFNPPGNGYHVAGKEYEKVFDAEWSKKTAWIAEHAPASAPQSPEFESGEEEEEDETEEAGIVDQSAVVERLQQQIVALSEQAAALSQGTLPGKTKGTIKKGKTAKPPNKAQRAASASALPTRPEKRSKPKAPVKVKPITNMQKQEISSKIGDLSNEEMARCAEIIKASLRRHGRSDLADKADDEMEYDIDVIPDDALHELLRAVRKLPPTGSTDDTEYMAPPTSSKRSLGQAPKTKKKSRPMSRYEQEQSIDMVKNKLNQFGNHKHSQGTGTSQAPDNITKGEDTSGDEDDSGSESEEE